MDDIKNTVKILERIAQRTFSIYECGALETAISALQELEQYRLREQIQWIPVEERTPEDMEIVLANDRSGNLYTAYHDCEGWHSAFNGLLFARDPLAWMPSPEPYHPLKEGADRKPPEWEQRVMNTFLGSRQEKKTDKTGTAEKPEKERL